MLAGLHVGPRAIRMAMLQLQLEDPDGIAFRENLSFRVPETVPVSWKA